MLHLVSCLGHTLITVLQPFGTDPEDVQSIAGHPQVSVTREAYWHVLGVGLTAAGFYAVRARSPVAQAA